MLITWPSPPCSWVWIRFKPLQQSGLAVHCDGIAAGQAVGFGEGEQIDVQDNYLRAVATAKARASALNNNEGSSGRRGLQKR